MSDDAPCCPRCGGEIIYDLTCHTYGQGDRFYACMPCDSAIGYYCAAQYDDDKPGDCRWEYTHGLNPRNPRAAENERNRPPWIPEGLSVNQRVSTEPYAAAIAMAVPGVRMAGA